MATRTPSAPDQPAGKRTGATKPAGKRARRKTTAPTDDLAAAAVARNEAARRVDADPPDRIPPLGVSPDALGISKESARRMKALPPVAKTVPVRRCRTITPIASACAAANTRPRRRNCRSSC